MGTDAPEAVEEWSGGYESNDYQSVKDEDAYNLAAALRRPCPR